MYRLPAEIGARVEEIDTPALLVDLLNGLHQIQARTDGSFQVHSQEVRR